VFVRIFLIIEVFQRFAGERALRNAGCIVVLILAVITICHDADDDDDESAFI
jgi:hypothetical protein